MTDNIMQYWVIDSRYDFDKEMNVMFAPNDKQEAIAVVEDIGLGTIVVRVDANGLREIVLLMLINLIWV